jgi:hypothetical protein
MRLRFRANGRGSYTVGGNAPTGAGLDAGGNVR